MAYQLAGECVVTHGMSRGPSYLQRWHGGFDPHLNEPRALGHLIRNGLEHADESLSPMHRREDQTIFIGFQTDRSAARSNVVERAIDQNA
jgi:hypothetical protein